MYTSPVVHPFITDGRWGDFHLWTTVNTAAVSTGVQRPILVHGSHSNYIGLFGARRTVFHTEAPVSPDPGPSALSSLAILVGVGWYFTVGVATALSGPAYVPVSHWTKIPVTVPL